MPVSSQQNPTFLQKSSSQSSCRRDSASNELKQESNSPAFFHIRNQDGFGLASSQISQECFNQLLGNPESLFESGGSRIIKQGKTAQVILGELQDGSQTFRIAYKRFCRKNFLKAITGLFQENRATQAFKTAIRFLEKGIPTPKPYVAVVPRKFTWKQNGYLAVEWLEDSQQLDELLNGFKANPDGQNSKSIREMSINLGKTIGKMHCNQISHHDLKAANILITEKEGRYQCYLIDLDGVTIFKQISSGTCIKNLSRLNKTSFDLDQITMSTRCRFLKTYCQENSQFPDWKELWRRVEMKTEGKHRA